MVKKVLFINEKNTSSVISGFLAGAGYGATEVFDAETGLGRLESNSYDLMVLLERPDAKSWALCSKIRSLTNTPIIVVSSGASPEACVMAINAGADFFIRKPFGPMELLARINALLLRTPSIQSVPLFS